MEIETGKLPNCEGCPTRGGPFPDVEKLAGLLKEEAARPGVSWTSVAYTVVEKLAVRAIRGRCGDFKRALGKADVDREHYARALTWIEQNLEWWLKGGNGISGGVRLVARALSETRRE